jgi:septum site-determining protein MinC
MSDIVAIKGARGGIRVIINDACPWDEALTALQYQLEQGSALLQGMRVSLEVGNRQLDSDAVQLLRDTMASYQVVASTIQAESRDVRQAARAAGFTTSVPVVQPPVQADLPPSVVMRTLRSGQVLRHHGDLTLLGDVNAGAEVIASGSIVVFGRISGLVYAGAMGDRNAIICALELSATQIRIADIRARAPEDNTHRGPEIARIEDDQIMVHLWQDYRR